MPLPLSGMSNRQLLAPPTPIPSDSSHGHSPRIAAVPCDPSSVQPLSPVSGPPTAHSSDADGRDDSGVMPQPSRFVDSSRRGGAVDGRERVPSPDRPSGGVGATAAVAPLYALDDRAAAPTGTVTAAPTAAGATTTSDVSLPRPTAAATAAPAVDAHARADSGPRAAAAATQPHPAVVVTSSESTQRPTIVIPGHDGAHGGGAAGGDGKASSPLRHQSRVGSDAHQPRVGSDTRPGPAPAGPAGSGVPVAPGGGGIAAVPGRSHHKRISSRRFEHFSSAGSMDESAGPAGAGGGGGGGGDAVGAGVAGLSHSLSTRVHYRSTSGVDIPGGSSVVSDEFGNPKSYVAFYVPGSSMPNGQVRLWWSCGRGAVVVVWGKVSFLPRACSYRCTTWSFELAWLCHSTPSFRAVCSTGTCLTAIFGGGLIRSFVRSSMCSRVGPCGAGLYHQADVVLPDEHSPWLHRIAVSRWRAVANQQLHVPLCHTRRHCGKPARAAQRLRRRRRR